MRVQSKSGGLGRIAQIADDDTTYYYLSDGLGSTTELADGDGTVTGAYAYDVFGPVRAHTGASTEWSYTGEQNDSSGLEYLRARYYDPAVGRFLTQDPIPFVQRYPYVGTTRSDTPTRTDSGARPMPVGLATKPVTPSKGRVT